MEYVHIKFHILTFLPIHSIYRVNIGKRGIFNKNIGIIGQFLKDRDFIGNIGTLEGLKNIYAPYSLIKKKAQQIGLYRF